MRGHLSPPLAAVLGHHIGGVDGQTPVGVDHHTEQARVGLREEKDDCCDDDMLPVLQLCDFDHNLCERIFYIL